MNKSADGEEAVLSKEDSRSLALLFGFAEKYGISWDVSYNRRSKVKKFRVQLGRTKVFGEDLQDAIPYAIFSFRQSPQCRRIEASSNLT